MIVLVRGVDAANGGEDDNDVMIIDCMLNIFFRLSLYRCISMVDSTSA